MVDANVKQIEEFRDKHCKSDSTRKDIKSLYEVQIESYEELLPGNTVRSYATGTREIDNAFIVFSVVDKNNGIMFHPIFSVTVGRKLASYWRICIPSKMSVFAGRSTGTGNGSHDRSHHVPRKKDNCEMLHLIQFARSMMILHISEPTPMKNPFKDIYVKLFDNPSYDVWESDIKSINTGIKNFLKKPVNTNNENFQDLQSYVKYLQRTYPTKILKNCDFDMLKDKMKKKYASEEIVF